MQSRRPHTSRAGQEGGKGFTLSDLARSAPGMRHGEGVMPDGESGPYHGGALAEASEWVDRSCPIRTLSCWETPLSGDTPVACTRVVPRGALVDPHHAERLVPTARWPVRAVSVVRPNPLLPAELSFWPGFGSWQAAPMHACTLRRIHLRPTASTGRSATRSGTAPYGGRKRIQALRL